MRKRKGRGGGEGLWRNIGCVSFLAQSYITTSNLTKEGKEELEQIPTYLYWDSWCPVCPRPYGLKDIDRK